jgi:hypothetical protein
MLLAEKLGNHFSQSDKISEVFGLEWSLLVQIKMLKGDLPMFLALGMQSWQINLGGILFTFWQLSLHLFLGPRQQ